MSSLSRVQGGAPAEIEHLNTVILIPKWLWFKRNLDYNLTSRVPVITTDECRVCCHCVLSEWVYGHLATRHVIT